MTNNTKKYDKDILVKMINDDVFFEEFYKNFYNRIYVFLLARSKDSDIAKELTNTTFFKIYANKKKLKADGNFMSYFYTIAINELRIYIKEKKKFQTLDSEILEVLANKYKESDFDYLDNEEILEQIEQILKTLNSEEKEIIQKKYFEDLSIREIAQKMQIKEGTIKSKISRTIDKIRKRL